MSITDSFPVNIPFSVFTSKMETAYREGFRQGYITSLKTNGMKPEKFHESSIESMNVELNRESILAARQFADGVREAFNFSSENI